MSPTRLAKPSLEPRPKGPLDAADRVALQSLAWTYCHAVDRRDYDLVRSCYHDDAIDDHGGLFCGSADDYVAWLRTVMPGLDASSHVIANMVFLIDGDYAEGELTVAAYHRTLETPKQAFTLGFRYLDRYRKRSEVWKLWRRTLALDWCSTQAACPAPAELGMEPGRSDRLDPCYARLPMFGAQFRG